MIPCWALLSNEKDTSGAVSGRKPPVRFVADLDGVRGNVTDDPSTGPGKRIVALIPVQARRNKESAQDRLTRRKPGTYNVFRPAMRG